MLVKESASTFRGGYYSHGKQFIAKLPIYRIDFDNVEQRKLHDEIVEKVHMMEHIFCRMKRTENSVTQNTLRRSAMAVNEELNTLIDRIYGVEGMRMVSVDESD